MRFMVKSVVEKKILANTLKFHYGKTFPSKVIYS